MKKTFIALALLSAGIAATPVFAQDAPAGNNGWFIGGNIGRAHLNKGFYDGNDTGYAIDGGYRWSFSPNVALGVEAGYNDLGNIKLKSPLSGPPLVSTSKSKLHGWTLGVDGHFNLTPNWYVSAHTGIYQWRGHGLSNDSNPLFRSVSKTDWYGGAGFGYDFSNNFSVGLNYDYFEAKKNHVNLSTDLISVSAEYRF